MIEFVSGIDTDAGKSVATGWLARRLMDAGRRVATMKLVQTGNVGASEDIARHRAMMGAGPHPPDAEGRTAPSIHPPPSSPPQAARRRPPASSPTPARPTWPPASPARPSTPSAWRPARGRSTRATT